MSMIGGLPVVVLYGWTAAMNTDWASFSGWHWVNLAQIAFGSGVIAMVFYYRGVAGVRASGECCIAPSVPRSSANNSVRRVSAP